MKSIIKETKITTVMDWKKKRLLIVNDEYQRGSVWNQRQEKLLIDSILRGYSIPQFYFHFIKTEADGLTSESYEIIDGQQRLNAMYRFIHNGFRLFNPQQDKRTGLPRFLLEQPCPWGGTTFETLPLEYKDNLLNTTLHIVCIESDDVNEIRELFVRLQAGLPLNAQEKRDAWPGNFSQFVIKTAGKKPSFKGHDFFNKMVKGTSEKRGGLRQACAQLFMTFYSRHHHGPHAFCNLNSHQIDEFYRHHLDFETRAPGSMVSRFDRILDKACELLCDGKRPALRLHSALHSVLLIDSMIDKFTSDWEYKFPKALDKFLYNLKLATKEKDESNIYWSQYGSLARTNSTEKDTIQRRHFFFVKEMLREMSPTRLDPKRAFSREERELLYFASNKKCSICGELVDWLEAEAHHKKMHVEGGLTLLENASLVHKQCHPRGRPSASSITDSESDEPQMDIPWEIEYESGQ